MANRWTLNEEHLNVDKYLKACANLYGYVMPRQFLKLYNRYNENKIKSLLNSGGRFVLSIDKNQSDVIEYGTRKIRIYPDRKENIAEYIKQSGMNLIKVFETEFTHIFISVNHLTRT